MIRVALLTLVFLAGLAAAGLWYGKMHHLRWIGAPALPAWTARIAPEAGLRQGRMEWGAGGLVPDLTLQWTASGLRPSGWQWDVRLTGAGIDLRGTMQAPLWPGSARIAVTGGQLDLGRLVPVPGEVAGLAEIGGGEIRVLDLRGTPRAEGRLTATVAGAALSGADLGAGPMTAELASDGTWRIAVDLQGGATGAGLTVAGTLPDRTGAYALTIDDAAGLPDAVRGQIAGAGQPAGDGWIVEGQVQAF